MFSRFLSRPHRAASAWLRRWRARRRKHDIANITTFSLLDRRLLYGLRSRGYGSTPLTVVRTPMPLGKSSHFLNRIDLGDTEEPATALVEKAVRNDSGELAFWRSDTWPDPILRTEHYNAISPLDIYAGKRVSVMYFPYVPALERSKKTLQREFRSNLNAIALAVADFNGHNLMKPGLTTRRMPRFEPARPTQSDLQLRLGVAGDDADALLQSWDQAHAAWQATRETQARLLWCLCHNDISPGNSTFTNGALTLADFGLACGGPVGSDLHTIVRWSGKAIADPAHIEGILATYTGRIQANNASISHEDVRLAAWATFFLRYTNLKFSSARYLDIYALAIRQMIEVSRIHSA